MATTARNRPAPTGWPIFFFNDAATNEIYTSLHTLSLHDALPISHVLATMARQMIHVNRAQDALELRSEEHTSELQSRNDSSYAVFCLKKKTAKPRRLRPAPQTLATPRLLPAGTCTSSRNPAFASIVVLITWPFFFFFNETASTEIYTSLHTLSLHDALPISATSPGAIMVPGRPSALSKMVTPRRYL